MEYLEIKIAVLCLFFISFQNSRDYFSFNGKPIILVEARHKDAEPSKALRKFQDFLKIPAVQLVENAEGCRLIPNGDQSILVAPAAVWLSMLP